MLIRRSIMGTDRRGRPVQRWRERAVCSCQEAQPDEHACCRRCYGAVPTDEEAEWLGRER